MDYLTINVKSEENIVLVKLNRPSIMNALNSQMREEIKHAVKLAPEQGRVLVITGEGKAFCSGQDLGEDVNIAYPDLERTLRDEYLPMLNEITNCSIPTIAAVNGPAAGAGANLALSFDVVIAAESAYFLQAFTRIGLMPDAGGTWFLPRKIGLAKAMGAALFADRIPATLACEWGMIWEAVPDEDFNDHWLERARQLANGPTVAYRKIRNALHASYENSLEEQIKLESKFQGEIGKSRDFKEGVLAFIEKRMPEFEGR